MRKKNIISLVESELKSAKVEENLHLTTSTQVLEAISCAGGIENNHRSRRPRSMTVCNQTLLSKIVKRDTVRRKTLTDITGNFNRSMPKPFM